MTCACVGQRLKDLVQLKVFKDIPWINFNLGKLVWIHLYSDTFEFEYNFYILRHVNLPYPRTFRQGSPQLGLYSAVSLAFSLVSCLVYQNKHKQFTNKQMYWYYEHEESRLKYNVSLLFTSYIVHIDVADATPSWSASLLMRGFGQYWKKYRNFDSFLYFYRYWSLLIHSKDSWLITASFFI